MGLFSSAKWNAESILRELVELSKFPLWLSELLAIILTVWLPGRALKVCLLKACFVYFQNTGDKINEPGKT